MQKNLHNSFYNQFLVFIKEKVSLTRCAKCNHRTSLSRTLKVLRCLNKKCRKTYKFFKSDIFEKNKITFEKILGILKGLFKNINTKALSILLEVSRKTIRLYRKKLKKLLKTAFKKEKVKLGGANIIVEVDESKVGSRKYNRGRFIDGVWVLGLVERTPERRIILIKLKNRNKKTLTKKIKKYVHKHSTIYSDEWKGYCDLKNHEFTHLTVNHSQFYVNPSNGVHTQTIEGNWSGLKTSLPRKHRNSRGINFYLLVYMFKRNKGRKLYEFLFNLF